MGAGAVNLQGQADDGLSCKDSLDQDAGSASGGSDGSRASLRCNSSSPVAAEAAAVAGGCMWGQGSPVSEVAGGLPPGRGFQVRIRVLG